MTCPKPFEEIQCRLIGPGEEEKAFSVIDHSFNSFVRDDFSPEGIDEFYRAIRSMIFNHPANHFIMIAESENRIIGVIDVRDNFHISIFFVEPTHMGQGIGRGLFDRALTVCQQKNPSLKEIEVHSSPWAVSVYLKLGFIADGPEQENSGIRFTRMVKEL